MTFGAVPSLHGPQGQTSLLPCSRWLLETWEAMPSAPFHLSDWGLHFAESRSNANYFLTAAVTSPTS